MDQRVRYVSMVEENQPRNVGDDFASVLIERDLYHYYYYIEDNKGGSSDLVNAKSSRKNPANLGLLTGKDIQQAGVKYYYYYYADDVEVEGGEEVKVYYTYPAESETTDSNNSTTFVDSVDESSIEEVDEKKYYYIYYTGDEEDKDISSDDLASIEQIKVDNEDGNEDGNEESIEYVYYYYPDNNQNIDSPATDNSTEELVIDDVTGEEIIYYETEEPNALPDDTSDVDAASARVSNSSEDASGDDIIYYPADAGDKPTINVGYNVDEDSELDSTYSSDQNGQPFEDSERSCLDSLSRNHNIYKQDVGFTFASEAIAGDLDPFLLHLSSDILDHLADNMLRCKLSSPQKDNTVSSLKKKNSNRDNGIYLIRYSDMITRASSCNPTYSPSNVCMIVGGSVTLVSDVQISKEKQTEALNAIKNYVEMMELVGSSRIISSQYLGPRIPPSGNSANYTEKIIVAVSVPLIASLLILVACYRSGGFYSRSKRYKRQFLF